MKKLFGLLFLAVALCISACGPSAEEKAKADAQVKAKMDSLFNAASKSVMDSTPAIAKPDTTKAK